MFSGDFNNLNYTQLRSYPLRQVVRLPTWRAAIFTNINNLHDPLKVLAPSGFSDDNIVVYEPATSFRDLERPGAFGYLPIWKSALVTRITKVNPP